ncbi:MAG: hypothetical protein IKE38_04260, partial [Erysipelotrichaceae bacterium]|nr:hypothetical protein [Erysipelotrichaceae bacterium]
KEVSTVYVFWIKYNVISGENQTWIIGSNKDLSFTLKRNFFDAGFGDGQYFLFPPTADTLASVEVDGTALSDSDYTAAPGSIKISLKPSFLNTLSKGTHTLKVSFVASDEPYGYKEIEFKVADKGSDGPYSVPDTCTK